MSAHITTDELFKYALPPEILFAPGRSDPGTVTEPVAAVGNVGLGTLRVVRGGPGKNGSNPRDTWAVKARVTTAGEVNSPGVINLAGTPRLAISLDNGATYGPDLEPDDTGRISHERSGLILMMVNGTLGAAVVFGSGNAALSIRPKQYGQSLAIVAGSALAVAFDRETGQLTLTVATGSTASAAATALNESGWAISAAAGGTGLGVVQVAARQDLPFVSFAVGDAWTMSTEPSADATLMIEAVSSAIDEALASTLALPADVSPNVKQKVAKLVRWEWISKYGMQSEKDAMGLEPKDVYKWMEAVADGTYIPTGMSEAANAINFPDRVTPPDPFLLARDGGSGIPI